MPDRELPEHLEGYTPGTTADAVVDENETKTVWVTEPTPTVWCQSCGEAIDAATIREVEDEERCPECGGNAGFYAEDPEDVDEDDDPEVYTDGKVDARAFWFEMLPRDNVPLRKKQSVLSEHLTTTEDGFNIDADYHIDLLEYQIRDWFGSDGEMGLKMFLTSMSTVFEDLQDEVPPPFPAIDEAEAGK